MQPFLRSFLAGVLAATALGLGLLVTLVLLAAGERPVFDDLLSLGAVVLAVVGAPLTGAVVGLVAARHARGPLGGLGAGTLAGLAGQFIVLVLVVVALAVGTVGSTGAPVAAAEDGLDADEFTAALLTLIPAALTAGLVGLAASRRAAVAEDPLALPAPAVAAADAPDLEDDDAPVASPASAPAPTASATARTLTCPRCHTPNEVPPGGGRITCRECGLVGRAG